MATSILVIACGAIAHELVRVRKMNGWEHIEIQCLPAELHNRPEKIPAAVRNRIDQESENFDRIFVAYADCGTGGMLDKALAGSGVERIPGAHCYEFLAGSETFNALADEEPGTFYLTDFLVHSFDRLVKEGLGLNRYPQLLSQYFGNYQRVVYLAQSDSQELRAKAKEHADYLGLDYEYRFCGLEPLNHVMKIKLPKEAAWQK